jgi:cysteine-rich repeat protein
LRSSPRDVDDVRVVVWRKALAGGLLLFGSGCYTGLPDDERDVFGGGAATKADTADGDDDGADDGGGGGDGADDGDPFDPAGGDGADDGGDGDPSDDGPPGDGGDDGPGDGGDGAGDGGPACGNGMLDPDEECDDGNANADSAGCKSDCTVNVCGDGAVGPGEACDDGNATDFDGCSSTCEIQAPSDLPDTPYCTAVSGWTAAWNDFEAEVIALVNQTRAQQIDCGGGNVLGPVGPVVYDPALTCAARNHSMDMGTNNFFSHTNLQGQGPGQRLDFAGYAAQTWGENIAAGYGTPQQVVDGWIASQGHCVNLMNGNFTELGVGYYYQAGSSYGHYWTQNFGKPQ